MRKLSATYFAFSFLGLTLLSASVSLAQQFDGEWRGSGKCSNTGSPYAIQLKIQAGVLSGNARSLSLGRGTYEYKFQGQIDRGSGAVTASDDTGARSRYTGTVSGGRMTFNGWTGEGDCQYTLNQVGTPQVAAPFPSPQPVPRQQERVPDALSPVPAPPTAAATKTPIETAKLLPPPSPDRDAFASQSTQEMAAVQRALAALGLYRGDLDGVYGAGTTGAIAAWQRSQGLPTTGYLSHAESDRLRNQALAGLGGTSAAPIPPQATSSAPQLANAGSAAGKVLREVDVPVVVCPVDGQVGQQTPNKEPRSIRTTIPEGQASHLVYYRGLQGHENVHVLAPRGWRCIGLYGSSGDTAFIVPPNVNPLQKDRFRGPAIEVRFRHGGTSGRTSVADTAGPLFPVAGQFIDEVEANFPSTEKYRRTPWPNEQVTRISERLLTFFDPPSVTGTGSQGRLAPSRLPIQGVVAFTEESNLWSLAVRLDEVDAALGPTILADFQALAARMIKPSPAIAPMSESAARPPVSGTPLIVLSQLTGLWVPVTAFPQGCAPSPHWIARSSEAMKIEPKRVWGYEWSCDVLNASGMADGALRVSAQCGHVEKEAATLTLSLALGRLTYKAQFRSGHDQTGIYQKCQR